MNNFNCLQQTSEMELGIAIGKDNIPNIVVLALIILRENQDGITEILLSTETTTDPLKKAGDMSWAGAETSRVIGNEVEGLQSNIVAALGEEVLAPLPNEQSIEARYIDWGNYWYMPGVLARLASIRLSENEIDQMGCRDDETKNLKWVAVEDLEKIQNWRNGMEDSARIIPAIVESDKLARQGLVSGAEVTQISFNGELLDLFYTYRSQFPDTKKVHNFFWDASSS